MTEQELLEYCLNRKFTWKDRVKIAICMNNKNIPLEEKVKFVTSFKYIDENLSRAQV